MGNNEDVNANLQDNADGIPNQSADSSASTLDYKVEFEKMKRLKDQYSSEASDFKKKYQATLTQAEQDKLANEEREKRYVEIEKENNLIKLTTNLKDTIRDEKVLSEVAKKLVDGDQIGAISSLNKYIQSSTADLKRQWEEEQLRSNPTPPPSNPNDTNNMPKKITDWSMDKWNKLKVEDPTAYKNLMAKIK